VVQLVADARHFQPVNHLRVGGAVRVCINRGEVIGFLYASAGIDGNGVQQIFARCGNRLGRAGISGPAAGFSREVVLSYNEKMIITIQENAS
jgi:hypothetical protein